MILLLLVTGCLPPLPAGPGAGDGDTDVSDSGISDGGDTDTDADADTDADSDTDTDTDTGADDADGDGFSVPDDCDDTDPDVNPDATEICDNGIDDNCDGRATPCQFDGDYGVDDAVGTVSGQTTNGYVGSSLAVVVMDTGPAVAVGAGWDNQGVVWFFQDFSPSDGSADLTTADATLSLRGEATGDQSGRAMAVADVDGDGHPDLLVGGYASTLLGSIATTRTTGPIVHIVHGPIPSSADDLYTAADVRITGGTTATATYGHIELDVADVMGLRRADVILSFHTFSDAAGTNAPVNRGGLAVLADRPAGELDLETDADLRIEGESLGDGLGAGLATVDVDGDGIDDIVVGGHGAGGADSSSHGTVYVVDASDYEGDGNIVSIDDIADLTIEASGATDRLGFTVADVGDVDGDGREDIAIGADGSIYGQPDAGEVLVFHTGGLPASGALTAGDADFRLQGQESGRSGGRLGFEIVPAGDVDHDGHDDFYASGIWEEVAGTASGRVHLVPGGLTGLLGVDDDGLLATFSGAAGTDFGVSMISNRDLTGDGVADLAVGAWSWSTGRGRVYAFASPTW